MAESALFGVASERAAAGAAPTALTRRQSEFAALMGVAQAEANTGQSAEQRARRAAEDFVATALIQPLLKNLRSTSTAAPPFAPGPAEKQFRGLMDAQLARQIAQASRFPLVDRLARDLLKAGPAPLGTVVRAGPGILA